MKLYIMRHGPAEDQAASGRDFDRALTASGRDRVRDVARALVTEDEAPLVILSSPLVRALQTAEIVAAATKLDGAVEVRREIAPGGNVIEFVTGLAGSGRKRVMIVGHEPALSELVQAVVRITLPLGMQKAMVVGVSLDDSGGARPRFVLDPKTLTWARSF